MSHASTRATEPFVKLSRAVNEHPITATELLLGCASVLHGPDVGRSVADTRSPRGAALRAIAYMAVGNTAGARNELRQIDAGLARQDNLAPPVDVARAAARPYIAYDALTDLLWGYGATLAHCQADAGWHVREAGGANEMATMRYTRADESMAEAWAALGPELEWHIDAHGVAVPGAPQRHAGRQRG